MLGVTRTICGRSPERLERPFLVARAMVAVNFFDRSRRCREKVRDVPKRARPFAASMTCAGVFQGVRGYVFVDARKLDETRE